MRTAPSILLAATATLLLGCSDSTGPSSNGGSGESGSSSFQVSPATATVQQGQYWQFTVTYSGNPTLSGGQRSAVWHSADENVASVSPSGLVRGVTGGQTRIVATWGESQASALVTVVGPMKKHEGQPVCMKRTTRAGAGLAKC
jgi:hypothetical protein